MKISASQRRILPRLWIKSSENGVDLGERIAYIEVDSDATILETVLYQVSKTNASRLWLPKTQIQGKELQKHASSCTWWRADGVH